MAFPTLASAALLLLAASARAGDYWVDVVNGDDANGGTSAADAWRTISHALAQLGPLPGVEVDVVHVLPGEYRKATGETFPLELRDRLWLRGEGGPEVTLLKGGLRVGVGDEPTGPGTGAEGFTILNQERGIQLQSLLPSRPVRRATFRDMHLQGCDRGVFVFVKDAASSGSSLTLEDSLIAGCWLPVDAQVLKQARFDLTLRGVSLRECGTLNLLSKNGAMLDFLFERSSMRITEFLIFGLFGRGTYYGGNLRATFRDSEVVSFCLGSTAMVLDGEVLIEGCTISGHDEAVRIVGTVPATLRDSIVWGNYTDLSLSTGGSATVENCVIDHRDFTGLNGNFSADPRFVDPPSGDFHLRFDSPCVDVLPSLRAHDWDGRLRDLDGDLDTLGGRDIGAFELRLLEGPESAALGDTVTLGVRGPSGAQAWVLLSREAPLVSPLQTPYGRQWLAAGTFVVAAVSLLDQPDATPIDLTLPANPVLAGSTLGLQALVRSDAAPAALALSEVIAITLE